MIEENRVFGNFINCDEIMPIQELDMVYIRKDIVLEDENDGNPLYSYTEVILSPYQYKQIKDKYSADEIFEHKKEILSIKELIEEENDRYYDFDKTDKIQLLSAENEVKSTENGTFEIDPRAITYGNTFQDSSKPSYDIKSTIYSSENFNIYNSAKNILYVANGFPFKVRGTNVVNQGAVIGEFNRGRCMFIANKRISVSWNYTITENTNPLATIQFQSGGPVYTSLSSRSTAINGQYNGSFSPQIPKTNFDGTCDVRLDNFDGLLVINAMQIELNAKSPTEYEPYEEYLMTLADVPQGIMSGNSIAECWDSFDYKTNTVSKFWNTVILNGNEFWSLSATQGVDYMVFYAISAFPNKKTGIGLVSCCNKLKNYPNFSDILVNEGFWHQNVANWAIMFSIKRDRLVTQDVAGFKTWLSTNNLTFLYQLQNPTAHAVTRTGNIVPYPNVNHISQNRRNYDIKCLLNLSVTFYPPFDINIYRIAFYPKTVDIKVIGTRGEE